jgi:hypothetical protein
LLQAGHDVVAFGCSSLLASVWAGQASPGFSLLSFTFISLFISGWGAETAINSLPAAIPDRCMLCFDNLRIYRTLNFLKSYMTAHQFFTFLPIFIFSIILNDNKKEGDSFKTDNSCYSCMATDSNKIKFVKNYSRIISIPELLDSFKGKLRCVDFARQ